jgi:hypothetical protein
MITKPKTRKAKAAKPAAPSSSSNREEDYATIEKWPRTKDENVLMVQAAEAGDDHPTDLRHTDELNRMKSRLFGLVATVEGAATNKRDGMPQLVFDVVKQMESCAKAFEAIHKPRLAKRGKGPREAA